MKRPKSYRAEDNRAPKSAENARDIRPPQDIHIAIWDAIISKEKVGLRQILDKTASNAGKQNTSEGIEAAHKQFIFQIQVLVWNELLQTENLKFLHQLKPGAYEIEKVLEKFEPTDLGRDYFQQHAPTPEKLDKKSDLRNIPYPDHNKPGTATLPPEDLSELETKTKNIRPSEDPEFQKYATENQWKTRRDRGLPWRKDVFEFVQEVYGRWIDRFKSEDRPLTQADIKAVDEPLWQKFQQEASKRGVPDDLDLPTLRRPITEGVDDPNELKRLEIVREYEKKRSRRRRNSLNNQ